MQVELSWIVGIAGLCSTLVATLVTWKGVKLNAQIVAKNNVALAEIAAKKNERDDAGAFRDDQSDMIKTLQAELGTVRSRLETMEIRYREQSDSVANNKVMIAEQKIQLLQLADENRRNKQKYEEDVAHLQDSYVELQDAYMKLQKEHDALKVAHEVLKADVDSQNIIGATLSIASNTTNLEPPALQTGTINLGGSYELHNTNDTSPVK